MATSGIIGSTIIDTAKIVDHAARRCGRNVSTLTPEELDTAMESLYTFLSALVNRGINLWAIDKELVGVSENRATYVLNPGTIDVLSVNYCTSTALAHTGTLYEDSYKAVFTSAVAVKLVGIYYNATREHDFIVEASNNGTSWSEIANLGTVQGRAGQWSWHDIDPAYSAAYFRIRDTRLDPNDQYLTLGVDAVRVCNQFSEIPITAMSRDTFNSLPAKRTPGRPVQYYFNKQIVPELVLNPEPNDTLAHLVVRRHRMIQDITSLQDEVEVPNRWYEAIIWGLAKLLSYELEGVDKERRLECAAHAATAMEEAEDGETDGSPFYMQPNISGYTR